MVKMTARWLAILTLLGSVVSGWGVGGAGEIQRQARVRDFWQLAGRDGDLPEGIREAALRAAQGNAALCRELFLEGAARYPDKAGWFHYQLGLAFSQLDREEAAMAALRRALELRKGLRVSFGYLALASLHERRGEVARAWKVFQELLAEEEALAVHLAEAAAFAQRHGMEDAQALFEAAMAKGAGEGPQVEARVLRRWAGLQPGDAALALYERLLRGMATEAADFQRAGVLAAELDPQGRWESFFEDGMKRHPEAQGWLRFEWAAQLEKAGRMDRALELYRAAKTDPKGLKVGYAYVGLAKLLEKTGEVEEASQVFAELLPLKEALPAHLAEAAAFEARRGRAEQGLERMFEAFQRAREEEAQLAVGNVLSEGMSSSPGWKMKEVADWFRVRTEELPEEASKRVRRALATAFGNHAWKLLTEGAFSEAESSAEMALVVYAPEVLKWVEGNRAHACLFQGRANEAREIHERYQNETLELDGLDWRQAAREDFVVFREKGLVTAEVEVEMRKLESLLGIGKETP